jgi:hypothetical protein
MKHPSQVVGCTIVLKREVLIYFPMLIYEFNCCAFHYVHDNESYVDVVKFISYIYLFD